MRSAATPRLRPGDRVTVPLGLYAGLEGTVVEVQEVSPLVGRARLELPGAGEYWHPFWKEEGEERPRKPYHKPVIDPAWLTWQAGLIPHLARLICDEGRFDEMPVLADALEDAGCTDDAILSHCRRYTLHARGCWVLDALRGRD